MTKESWTRRKSPVHSKRALHMSKEPYPSQKSHVKRAMSKEPNTLHESPTHVKRALYMSKEPYTSRKSHTHYKRALYMSKEPYKCPKSPVKERYTHLQTARVQTDRTEERARTGRPDLCACLEYVAVCCGVLRCVAVCYSVLQCVGVCCSV